MDSNPILNPAVMLAPGEDGYVAYNPIADTLHRLNPLASLIVELCDGTRSVNDIAELLAPLNMEGGAEAIESWAGQGMAAGLLVRPEDATRVLTAEELSELGRRLEARGDLQPSFLCRKRVAELTPDDTNAWYALGNVAFYLGKREEAREAYAKYLEFRPGDARLATVMAALKDEAPPTRAPDECIQQIYRGFSVGYDTVMREELDYRSPEHVWTMVETVMGGREGLKALDLGCGSGLAGVHLRVRAKQLVGVDLSPEMVALANARAIYDRLDVAEIGAWLERNEKAFDLIVACEVLVYFGDLLPIMRAVAQHLTQGGVFVFTVERGEEPGYRLTDWGRYVHDASYIQDAAKRAGLSVERIEEAFLRLEYGAPVTGLIVALKKPH